MFIECYRVPVHDWDSEEEKIKIPENKVLIPLSRIEYVQTATHRKDRAEILLSSDKRVFVLGSYEDILSRIENLGQTTHIMHRLKT
jgi:hypothetical protein